MSTTAEKRWFAAVGSLPNCVLCGAHPVQVAHRNKGKGMGLKTAPWMTAALCQECHHEIDNGRLMTREERRAAMDDAIVRTHEQLIHSGLLRLAE